MAGWICALEVGGQTFELLASDVPDNTVQELVDALDALLKGRSVSLFLHQEPTGHFLDLEPVGDQIRLRLSYAHDYERRQGARELLDFTASRSAILLPIWRFLRWFESRSFAEPHWPPVDFGRCAEWRSRISG